MLANKSGVYEISVYNLTLFGLIPMFRDSVNIEESFWTLQRIVNGK